MSRPLPAAAPTRFVYEEAFSRTLGWVTPAEQQALRGKRIAIGGLGGVGGGHALCLARLGIGAMHLADLDRFELANMNRQAGAGMHRLGCPKVDVTMEQVRQINPECDLRAFPSGISVDTIGDFLAGVDLYVDGLDLYALDARALVFAECHRRGIPAVTAGPLGMSTALFAVMPGGMSFEQYVRWDGCDDRERLIRFVVALAPTAAHRAALVDRTAVDLARQRGPSTPMGCCLATGALASEALKILLGRGPVTALPRTVQYDAYSQRIRRTWRPWGNANPLQRLVLAAARRQVHALGRHARPVADPESGMPVERIIALARWAPSADNAQPWRFTDCTPERFSVRVRASSDHGGVRGLLAAGALGESIRLAASTEGLRATVAMHPAEVPGEMLFGVRLATEQGVRPDPLARWIPVRCVNRFAYRRRVLTDHEREELERSVGPGFAVRWLAGAARWDMAMLNLRAARLRLARRDEVEAMAQRLVDWDADFSFDRVPGGSLGMPPALRGFVRWGLASWERTRLLRAGGALLLPCAALGLLPGLRCAAHAVLLAGVPPQDADAWLAAGAAVQRFWLTATRLGLQHQPGMGLFTVARRAREESDPAATGEARALLAGLEGLVGREDSRRIVWLGRIGAGTAPGPRALRLSLDELLAPQGA